MCKMNTREAGTKIIKCNNGTYEKQYRQNLGKLVVAYRCLSIPLSSLLVELIVWQRSDLCKSQRHEMCWYAAHLLQDVGEIQV